VPLLMPFLRDAAHFDDATPIAAPRQLFSLPLLPMLFSDYGRRHAIFEIDAGFSSFLRFAGDAWLFAGFAMPPPPAAASRRF